MKGLITNLQRFSLHDGPGIRTTVFLKGCPLHCVWCHNPENISPYNEVIFLNTECIACKRCIDVCPMGCFSWHEKIIFSSEKCNKCGCCIGSCPVRCLRWAGYEITIDEILPKLLADKDYYDFSGGGVTLSGGEPFYQFDFTFALLEQLKKCGIHTAVDSCADVDFVFLEKVLPFVDIFLFDLKLLDAHNHYIFTGKDNIRIIENIKHLADIKKPFLLRVPMIKNVTDTKENIDEIKIFVDNLPIKTTIEFIPFNQLMREKYLMLGRPCMDF